MEKLTGESFHKGLFLLIAFVEFLEPLSTLISSQSTTTTTVGGYSVCK